MSDSSGMIDCKEIIVRYLRDRGFDGLCEPETECGCGLDDFAPCGDGPYPQCRPARAGVLGDGEYLGDDAGPGDTIYLVADDAPPTRAEIAARLRAMAGEMDDIVVAMDYYGGLAEWAQHGREIAGAGHVARQWAAEIEAAVANASGLHAVG